MKMTVFNTRNFVHLWGQNYEENAKLSNNGIALLQISEEHNLKREYLLKIHHMDDFTE